MKKVLFAAFFFIYQVAVYAQANPTLAIGLETLTMNKGTIDVKVLTEIIVEKQKELKQEALKRFMLKLFPDANYTTRFYLQNALHILLNEKNPQVIEKEILELTTNYALSLGVAYAMIESNDSPVNDILQPYRAYENCSRYYLDNESDRYRLQISKKDKLDQLENKRKQYNDLVLADLNQPDRSSKGYRKLRCHKRKLKQYEDKIARLKFRYGLFQKNEANLPAEQQRIPFGVVLDVVSLSLSDIPELQKKGFFKNRIAYTEGEFYLNLSREQNAEGIALKQSLDTLKVDICKKISLYVEHYEVIKEFVKKGQNKKVADILNELNIENSQIALPFIKAAKPGENAQVDGLKAIMEEITNASKTLNKLNDKAIDKLAFPLLKPGDVPTNDEQAIRLYNDFMDKRSKINGNLKNDRVALPDFIVVQKTAIDKISLPQDTIAQNQEKITQKIAQLNERIEKFNNSPETDHYKDVLSSAKSLQRLIDRYNDSVKTAPVRISNEIVAAFGQSGRISIDIEKYNNRMAEMQRKAETALKVQQEEIRSLKDEIGKSQAALLEGLKKLANDPSKHFNAILDDISKAQNFQTDGLDSITVRKVSKILPELYTNVMRLVKNKQVTLKDIHYLEETIIAQMIELKIRDKNTQNDAVYNSIIKHIREAAPLLKMMVIEKIKDFGGYDQELMDLFEFLSNLNKLDKAETYQSIVNMLRDGSLKVETNLSEGEFKESYQLFINAMKKYTLINTNKEYVEIDVVSFLNDLQQYYGRNTKSWLSLYLTLGLNQNFFLREFHFPESQERIKNISFASEKIGLKTRFYSFKKYAGYEHVVKNDIYLNKKAPFVNEVYGILYGSGLLYSLANTVTNENFDFPHAGIGTGIRFYNALDINVTLGFPFIKDRNFGDNAFIGIGLDIPLGEYLEKLGRKN